MRLLDFIIQEIINSSPSLPSYFLSHVSILYHFQSKMLQIKKLIVSKQTKVSNSKEIRSLEFQRRIHPFKRQPHKLVKHTQRICREFPDKLFEYV